MKKLLLSILFFTLFAFFAYIAFMLFIISGDTEAKEKLCSQYIVPLNNYKNNNTHYPTLEEAKKLNLNVELSLEDCRYRVNDEKNEFSFSVSEGLWIAGYNSENAKWWHD